MAAVAPRVPMPMYTPPPPPIDNDDGISNDGGSECWSSNVFVLVRIHVWKARRGSFCWKTRFQVSSLHVYSPALGNL